MSISFQPPDVRPSQQNARDGGEASFRYQPLESPATFRLLQLYAGTGDRIFCSLHHHTLGSESCPQYLAISYTWGKDAARFDIHMPHDSLLKIRENLRNALKAMRDPKSDSWLWIDALCINQKSKEERNHQVRLMAQIYSNADCVMVWLQSANESTNPARAFKFVHAAVTYSKSNPEHSVYRYLKTRSHANDRDWRSLQNLCKLRYWTRKWIIQELVIAQDVVLQSGKNTCSMTDLETFCYQLDRNKDDEAYKKLRISKRDVWDFVLGSEAGRLALQRTETMENQQPRLLYELIERYESSECQESCDHVYALYNLVGDHRQHLNIDYGASPVERLVAVLRFIHVYERLAPSRVLHFAKLLIRLFNISQKELAAHRHLLETLDLVVSVSILGTAEPQGQSNAVMAARETVDPLAPMNMYALDTSQNICHVARIQDHSSPPPAVGRKNMSYFKITDRSLYGLAACSLRSGDTIWHIPGTQLAFVIREFEKDRGVILGRSYLFVHSTDSEALKPWVRQRVDYRIRKGKIDLSMDLATVLELDILAVSTNNRRKQPRADGPAGQLTKDLRARFIRNWKAVVIMISSIFIFALLVATVAIETR